MKKLMMLLALSLTFSVYAQELPRVTIKAMKDISFFAYPAIAVQIKEEKTGCELVTTQFKFRGYNVTVAKGEVFDLHLEVYKNVGGQPFMFMYNTDTNSPVSNMIIMCEADVLPEKFTLDQLMEKIGDAVKAEIH